MTCPSCAAMAERLETEANRNEALQDELVEAGRSNKGLRSALAQLHKTDVPDATVEFIVNQWRLQTGRRTGPIGPKQEKVVKAAVKAKWCGRDKALKAIRGYCRYPFVVEGVMGRTATPSSPAAAEDERFDELVRMLEDDEQVRKGCALADRADREDGLSTDTPPWVCEHLDAWPVFDELGPRPSIKSWVGTCPVCSEPNLLRVVWVDQGAGVFEVACARRCDPAEVLRRCEALRDGVEDQQRLAA